MKTNRVKLLPIDEFIRRIASDGSFLKCLMIQAESKAKAAESNDETYILTYLIEDVATGLFKIGKTNNIQKRISILSCGNPNLRLYAWVEDDVETELHEKFAKNRIKREWFNLSNSEVRKITSEYNMIVV